MKILTIGSATYDILIKYEAAELLERTTPNGKQSLLLLEEGKKVEVDDVVYRTGGGATNSAVAFVRLGFDATSFFKIGTDYQADYILEVLAKEGVSTRFAKKTTEYPSSVSFIISGKSGDRTVLVYRGAARTMQRNELPLEALQRSDCVYVSSLSGNGMSLLPCIAQTARQHNAYVAINPGSSQLKKGISWVHDALPNVDILMLNNLESRLFMHSLLQRGMASSKTPSRAEPSRTALTISGHLPRLLQSPLVYEGSTFSLTDYFATIHELGPRFVVLTDGKEGVYVSTQESILFHPSIQTNVVSTLGAGDAFGSGFTAGIVQGKTPEDAIRMGCLNSAGVISDIDAKTGLLTKSEMENRLVSLDKHLLQHYSLS